MKTFLVGGAVRDRLLSQEFTLASTDRDWVVVGSTPEAMITAGFKPVGKDFPVFLHPQTHEEYALARAERKTAPGYHGFSFNADPGVSLEEDLQRRDLTINAMAESPEGTLIDPWGGQSDLHSRTLRHVTDAFAEDPVRILRVARFSARLAPLGFTIAEETMSLMRGMVTAGEVDALVPERVWQELSRALVEARPSAFIDTLRCCGALERILPEVDALFGVPQREAFHPEVDSGLHTLMVIDQVRAMQADAALGLAALCHDLGKALTPRAEWPRHHGHDARGVLPARELCSRMRVPKAARELALLVTEHHTKSHTVFELTGKALLKLFQQLDVYRKPERLVQFTLCCQADARGRWGFESAPYPNADFLLAAAEAVRGVDARAVAASCADPARIPEAIHRARLTTLNHWLKQNRDAANVAPRPPESGPGVST